MAHPCGSQSLAGRKGQRKQLPFAPLCTAFSHPQVVHLLERCDISAALLALFIRAFQARAANYALRATLY